MIHFPAFLLSFPLVFPFEGHTVIFPWFTLSSARAAITRNSIIPSIPRIPTSKVWISDCKTSAEGKVSWYTLLPTSRDSNEWEQMTRFYFSEKVIKGVGNQGKRSPWKLYFPRAFLENVATLRTPMSLTLSAYWDSFFSLRPFSKWHFQFSLRQNTGNQSVEWVTPKIVGLFYCMPPL